MSTTIITQFNGQKSETTEGSSSRSDDVCIEVCNPITHGEGKDKYTDYEIKVRVSNGREFRILVFFIKSSL